MSASLHIAGEEFHRAAEQCIKHSERTYHQFINGQSLAVASRAIKETERANAQQIAAQLAKNVSVKSRTSAKTGKVRNSLKYSVDQNTLAARIINARLIARGEKPIWGKELSKAARRMVGARIKAVNFIRSGWIYAVKTLSAAVGYSAGPRDGARMTGVAKGYAKPARPAVNSVVSAEIANTALLRDKRTPLPVAERGLSAALSFVAKDMLAHLAKKLDPVFKEVSAK